MVAILEPEGEKVFPVRVRVAVIETVAKTKLFGPIFATWKIKFEEALEQNCDGVPSCKLSVFFNQNLNSYTCKCKGKESKCDQK